MTATEINYKRIKAINMQVTQWQPGNKCSSQTLLCLFSNLLRITVSHKGTNKITKKRNRKHN